MGVARDAASGPRTAARDGCGALRADTSSPLVVVLGPPGAGKGTQCRLLAAETGWGHLSMGDHLRGEISRQSPLGSLARRYVEAGQLVPDELVTEIALDELSHHAQDDGVMLDGFPRTIAQAESLAAAAPALVTVCVVLVVPREQILARLLARGRPDDRPGVLRTRLLAYERETRPLVDWYSGRGHVEHVDGSASPACVASGLRRVLVRAGVVSGTTPAIGHEAPG